MKYCAGTAESSNTSCSTAVDVSWGMNAAPLSPRLNIQKSYVQLSAKHCVWGSLFAPGNQNRVTRFHFCFIYIKHTLTHAATTCVFTFLLKKCQTGNLPNRRSPRRNRRTFSGSPRQAEPSLWAPGGELAFTQLRFGNTRWKSCSFSQHLCMQRPAWVNMIKKIK